MSDKIHQQVQVAIKKLHNLEKEFDVKERRKLLKEPAKILVEKAKANIPESDKPHHRYSTAKASKQLRAPKGLGNIIATYYYNIC